MNGNSLPILVSREEIEATVGRVAREIGRDYGAKEPLLVGVLKGSFIFLADLVRRMDIPCQVEFVRLSSYGSSAVSSGKIKVVSPLPGSIRGRDVVVVEDIVDSGLTISFLLNYLRRKRPASVKLCAMFVKGSPGDFPFPIDYMGMEIPKEFVVGYGLDFNEEYRYLPDLRILESEAD